MPVEWGNPKSILLALPNVNTDWAYIIDEATAQYDRLIESMIEGGERLIILTNNAAEETEAISTAREKGNLIIKNVPYNDTWTRDYGPITI